MQDDIALLPSRRNRVLIATIWLAGIAMVVIPGGVITQIWRASESFDERVAASPLGKLCYACGQPAVQFAEYTDGSVRYFCDRHPPPQQARATSAGDKGSKGLNPYFCIAILSVFFGANTVRALAYVVRPWKICGAPLALDQ